MRSREQREVKIREGEIALKKARENGPGLEDGEEELGQAHEEWRQPNFRFGSGHFQIHVDNLFAWRHKPNILRYFKIYISILFK